MQVLEYLLSQSWDEEDDNMASLHREMTPDPRWVCHHHPAIKIYRLVDFSDSMKHKSRFWVADLKLSNLLCQSLEENILAAGPI